MAHVLVVDDDQVVRILLRDVLETAGHDVSFARDGLSAADIFRSAPFDVVITDLAMPVRSGLWAIRQILEDQPQARIIAISGQDAGFLPKAEDLGAYAVLTKPIERRVIQALVEEIVASSRVWDDAHLM